MEELNDNLVRVNIYGQEYTVKSKADRAYIISVANYVNDKMEEIEASLRTVQTPIRVAILAAMNITDELFTANQERDKIVSSVEEKAGFLIDIIDEKLNEEI
ncbi:MAG: cell division protein ZapA [Candidatus Marinimicrobia bacterium]|jgi:cell division protein ZapA|nr:cell division protein ZapA [Candidatus Neomarinimicrobiota bacterium]MCK9483355.1 cell division protein ZapA [Candidatus Neomarinimicrobiota bacterium]MCK9560287.1 cell division protein ZapA [Candidatus Neomarinimicrobiota bacterium]MDD5230754.1 cell division protein ZapA [Candidatus Neomarinimicrobiota bacterium]MDD5541319.1 cell division protein ZapA [Candidatus Neomarinimicrobiota bacterium]